MENQNFINLDTDNLWKDKGVLYTLLCRQNSPEFVSSDKSVAETIDGLQHWPQHTWFCKENKYVLSSFSFNRVKYH